MSVEDVGFLRHGTDDGLAIPPGGEEPMEWPEGDGSGLDDRENDDLPRGLAKNGEGEKAAGDKVPVSAHIA